MSNGSVMSDMIDCPQCGYPAQKDDYFVVGEERVVCDYCGYSHIKTNENLDTSKGYGSLHKVSRNESKNGSNLKEKIIRFKQPLGLIDRNKYVLELSKSELSSSLYVWNEELKQLETIVGKKPQTLDEMYCEQCNEDSYYRSLNGNNNGSNEETVEF